MTALCAAFGFRVLRGPRFRVQCTTHEDSCRWVAVGNNWSQAFLRLRREIENATSPFDYDFQVIWAEAELTFKYGQRIYTHFDFSVPEQSFTLEAV